MFVHIFFNFHFSQERENLVFYFEYIFHVAIFFLYFAFSCYGGEKLKNLVSFYSN